MPRIAPILFTVLIALSSFLPQDAKAQTLERGEAVLSANGYRDIAAGATIAVHLADDSDINLRLREVATRALQRAGYTVVESGAAHTLRLESKRRASGAAFDQSIGSLHAGSSVGRPEGNSGGPRGDGVDVNVRLWSTTRNSLLNPKSAGSAPKQGFGVTLDAFEEATRKPAWHGAVRTDDTGGDSYRAGSAMVKHLVDALGLTIEAEYVSLR